MTKNYCDICGAEADGGLVLIDDQLAFDLLEAIGVEDVCPACAAKLNHSDVPALVRTLITNMAGKAGKN